MAGRKLNDEKPNEEDAVKQVCEIFRNISTDLIRLSWRMTGFKKFAHFEEASDPKVTRQDIENELNERLHSDQNMIKPQMRNSHEFRLVQVSSYSGQTVELACSITEA